MVVEREQQVIDAVLVVPSAARQVEHDQDLGGFLVPEGAEHRGTLVVANFAEVQRVR